MAGQIRLFEKTDKGLLVEIDPAQADARRASGAISHTMLSVDILWTDAEIAERDAQEKAAREALEKAAAAGAAAEKAAADARASAQAKLAALGLTVEEVGALLK